MNESYTSFAQVYDMFMDNVDYPAWSKYLIQLLMPERYILVMAYSHSSKVRHFVDMQIR